MPTTNSTNPIRYRTAKREPYYPRILRAVINAATSSGGSYLSSIFDTHGHSAARLTLHCKALGAATTVSAELLTGPTSAAASIVQHCIASSGTTALAIATTVAGRRVFSGLNRWARVAYYCAGTNASTDVSVDLELL